MFVNIMLAKNNIVEYGRDTMSAKKTTQYGGYVVMFLPNKIIINKKFNYPPKNVGLAHGFKTM